MSGNSIYQNGSQALPAAGDPEQIDQSISEPAMSITEDTLRASPVPAASIETQHSMSAELPRDEPEDLDAPRDATPSVMGDASTSISVTPAPTADSSEPRDTNTAFRRRKVKHYESERLALLHKDPQIDEVEEYRVLCGFCEKWIDLRKDRPYCPIAWTAHKLRCVNRRRKSGPPAKKIKKEHASASTSASAVPPESPSGTVQIRRTEEERVQFLVSDPHATTVEPHRILCGICNRWIQLRKNSTYCTAPWVQHVKKCAIKHEAARKVNGSSATHPAYGDGEDEIESEDGRPRQQPVPEEPPVKRGRGRPRKRKLGVTQNGQPTSFALRPVSGASPSPSNNHRASRRSSASPPPPRTPSPALDHPYSNDMYWYPALPPMSSYYPLYAGSQYNENDDSYSLYFHAQPPAHQFGPTPGQGRFRAKPPKQMFLTPGGAPGAVWHGSPPASMPSGSTPVPISSTSPGPDGSSPQPGRAWIVWRLKDYSTNPCPMDPTAAPDPRASSAPRGGSEASGSSSEALPMFRSGTWPHLLDPQDLNQQHNLTPYMHPEIGKENGSTPVPRTGQLAPPPLPPPPPEDPALISFNSSAHIPIRASEPYVAAPQPLPPPVPDPNIDPRFSMAPPPGAAVPPEAPTGADLDSPECRLAFTFQAIAFLFSTSFQGADDMSLDTLMAFMNRTIPTEKMYDGQEVSQHVAILGERKQLVFTKEGGVQLLATPP